jgi:TetR/AcrR family transcriptional repressor of nem operon
MTGDPSRHASKTKLLAATIDVVRMKGYCAMRIEDVCAEAGLTKGSFFHHFKSKDELAIEAAEFWSDNAAALFATAPYHAHADPLERVLGYVDLRRSILTGEIWEFTCFAGTAVQEIYKTHPPIREACERVICGHAATLEPDIAEAMRLRRIKGKWSAKSLALHTQAVLQGAFILAKATGDAQVAAQSVDHLHRYIELLFRADKPKAR